MIGQHKVYQQESMSQVLPTVDGEQVLLLRVRLPTPSAVLEALDEVRASFSTQTTRIELTIAEDDPLVVIIPRFDDNNLEAECLDLLQTVHGGVVAGSGPANASSGPPELDVDYHIIVRFKVSKDELPSDWEALLRKSLELKVSQRLGAKAAAAVSPPRLALLAASQAGETLVQITCTNEVSHIKVLDSLLAAKIPLRLAGKEGAILRSDGAALDSPETVAEPSASNNSAQEWSKMAEYRVGIAQILRKPVVELAMKAHARLLQAAQELIKSGDLLPMSAWVLPHPKVQAHKTFRKALTGKTLNLDPLKDLLRAAALAEGVDAQYITVERLTDADAAVPGASISKKASSPSEFYVQVSPFSEQGAPKQALADLRQRFTKAMSSTLESLDFKVDGWKLSRDSPSKLRLTAPPQENKVGNAGAAVKAKGGKTEGDDRDSKKWQRFLRDRIPIKRREKHPLFQNWVRVERWEPGMKGAKKPNSDTLTVEEALSDPLECIKLYVTGMGNDASKPININEIDVANWINLGENWSDFWSDFNISDPVLRKLFQTYRAKIRLPLSHKDGLENASQFDPAACKQVDEWCVELGLCSLDEIEYLSAARTAQADTARLKHKIAVEIYEKRMRSLEQGPVPTIGGWALDEVMDWLAPSLAYGGACYLTGKHFAGKTTLMARLCHRLKVDQEHYVVVPTAVSRFYQVSARQALAVLQFYSSPSHAGFQTPIFWKKPA